MTARVFHTHLWGKREDKYAALEEHDVSTIEWTEIEPEKPFSLFVPQDRGVFAEYQQGWKINEVFPVNSTGIKTHRDHFVVDFDQNTLEARLRDFLDTRHNDEEVRMQYGLKDNRDWQMAVARKLKASEVVSSIHHCLYRPFDMRSLAFHPGLIDFGRWEVMRNMLEPNLGLLICRQSICNEWKHVVCTDSTSVDCTVSGLSRERNSCVPLYIYPPDSEGQGDLLAAKEKQPNLAPEFVEALSDKLGLPFDPSVHRGLHTAHDDVGQGLVPCQGSPQGTALHGKTSWNPEDLFCYAYAVFHSPTYRERYTEFLKIDFPRLPLTSDTALFFKLADLGEELVLLHLMRESRGHVTSTCPLDSFITSFPHSGSNEVEKLRYEDGNIWFNKDQCFSGVDEEDWNFHIGGYQALAKWLKDRKSRTLSFDDIEHYQKIVVAIHETRCLMAAIDTAIPVWPLR